MLETSYRSNKARSLISGCAASTGKRPEYTRKSLLKDWPFPTGSNYGALPKKSGVLDGGH